MGQHNHIIALRQAGFEVARIDQGDALPGPGGTVGDFGHATSSASTKLIPGGLRYLAMGDTFSVKEMLQLRSNQDGIGPQGRTYS